MASLSKSILLPKIGHQSIAIGKTQAFPSVKPCLAFPCSCQSFSESHSLLTRRTKDARSFRGAASVEFKSASEAEEEDVVSPSVSVESIETVKDSKNFHEEDKAIIVSADRSPDAEIVQSNDKSEIAEPGEDGDVSDDPEMEKGYRMSRICDRLIEVFGIEKNDPAEWRKLLAFSKDWSRIRPYFFKRCKQVAADTEDPKKQEILFKLARRLKDVDDDMERHNDLFRAVEGAEDLNTVVTYRRKDFTSDFFDHLKLLAQTQHKDPTRAEEIISLATSCLVAVNGHDQFMSNKEAMEKSRLEFENILASPDLQTACGKIDELANNNKLDPHLVMMITKAWAATRETHLVKEDVQDMMYGMYLTAVANQQKMLPKEIRILKHLMSIEDPRRLFEELVAAFSPGDQLETKDIEYLYTTPKDLHSHIETLLQLFDLNQQSSSVEVNKMINPAVVNKLVVIKDMIEKEFF